MRETALKVDFSSVKKTYRTNIIIKSLILPINATIFLFSVLLNVFIILAKMIFTLLSEHTGAVHSTYPLLFH